MVLMKTRWIAIVTGVLLSPGAGRAAEPVPSIDLDPKLIESSPVLQRWLKKIPDVSSDIANDPSFRTRIRAGYLGSDLYLGLEDLRIAQTRLTASADYRASNWGANLNYYVRPLGSYVNIAPTLGYRQIETPNQTIEGMNLGVRAVFILSRGGGADIALSQTWVSPLSAEETGLTTLSVGYAVTRNLRVATDFQKQNSRDRKEKRFGISLEWMP